jgi:hypothetical protein
LFEQFDAMLKQAGYIAMSGQIVDASLVAAPRLRNTDDEKKAIKQGRIPANWKAKPAKLRHKDRDARWTVKFSKAKPRADGSMPPVDLAIPLSAVCCKPDVRDGGIGLAVLYPARG